VIFQTYKNVVLKSVHSLGWLLWLCFYPTINCAINARRGVLLGFYIFKTKRLWDDYINGNVKESLNDFFLIQRVINFF
jgi:hypothetical protein